MLVKRKNYWAGVRMATLSPSELLNWLGQYQFLAPPQVDELRPLMPSFPDTMSLAKELIRRDWLTPFQVNQIMKGQQDELVLGSYRLRERIGEGAMGAVFTAWNLRMGRVVAVKTINKELINSAKALERFRREVQTVAQLDHPNIALVRDADEIDGKPYMIMDFIEGFNLSQRVKQVGAMPIGEAVEYIRQAALGLQHAFERGIVHRDIKPANLVVTTTKNNHDPRPLVKILDFGLARYESESDNADRLTQFGHMLGTVDYVAPEQAQNARNADIRADIYGLGCSLFYMLAGQTPFQGNSVLEKLSPRVTDEAPWVRTQRAEVPPALEAVLRTMMARQPDDRYQTPIEVAQALQPFADATPSAAPAGVVMAMPVMAGADSRGACADGSADPGHADCGAGRSDGRHRVDAVPFGERESNTSGSARLPRHVGDGTRYVERRRRSHAERPPSEAAASRQVAFAHRRRRVCLVELGLPGRLSVESVGPSAR